MAQSSSFNVHGGQAFLGNQFNTGGGNMNFARQNEATKSAVARPSSSTPATSNTRWPRKLLSLDGGGIRGLSSIIILSYLMDQICEERNERIDPWQEFDMIGGTSTGGLIAIMLGRLRMSILDCETTYSDLVDAVFTPKRPSYDPRRVTDFLKANGKFDEQPLETLIREKITEAEIEEDALLKDEREDACKIFVSVVRLEDSSPSVLRSYTSGRLINRQLPYCKIWEAARATSAASTFFDPITIGPHGTQFVDGGLRHNNPIDLLERESRNLWPTEDRIIISIGTGDAPGGSFEGSLKDLVDRLKEIATDAEVTSNRFLNDHSDMIQSGRLFRFNVHSLGSIGLDESKQKSAIVARTEHYLETADVFYKSGQCIDSMVQGGKRELASDQTIASEATQLSVATVEHPPPQKDVFFPCSNCIKGLLFEETLFYFCLLCHSFFCLDCGAHLCHKSALLYGRARRLTFPNTSESFKTRCLICEKSIYMRIECLDCEAIICLGCVFNYKKFHAWLKQQRHPEQDSSVGQHQKHLSWLWHYLPQSRMWRERPSGTGTVAELCFEKGFIHCLSCLNVISDGSAFLCCATCHRTNGVTEPICLTCSDNIDADHRRLHQFQTFITMREETQRFLSVKCNTCAEEFTSIPVQHEHGQDTFGLYLGAKSHRDIVLGRLRWYRCPILHHEMHESRSVLCAKYLTCSCGEPIAVNVRLSCCRKCSLFFCTYCRVQGERRLHKTVNCIVFGSLDDTGVSKIVESSRQLSVYHFGDEAILTPNRRCENHPREDFQFDSINQVVCRFCHKSFCPRCWLECTTNLLCCSKAKEAERDVSLSICWGFTAAYAYRTCQYGRLVAWDQDLYRREIHSRKLKLGGGDGV